MSESTMVNTDLKPSLSDAPCRCELHSLVLYWGCLRDIWVCLGKFSTFVCADNHDISLSQDFLMDWSLCKPRSRYPLLRPELVYKSQIPVRFLVPISPTPLTMS